MRENHKSYENSKFGSTIKGAFLLVLFTLLLSCADEEPALNESFFKIYDDTDLDVSYRPIDVVETVDGYIILAGTELSKSDFMGVKLIKIDEEGNYEFDLNLDDYVVPVGDMYLNQADSNVYFFAMTEPSFQAVLIAVNPQLEIELEQIVGTLNYPLSSAQISNGNLLLQSYDNLTQEIELSEVTLQGTVPGSNRVSYSIGPGDDEVVEIINHYLNASERPLPFFCGEVSPGNYYFNGFYNYNFSLVFTDFSSSPQGVVQGQASSAGLRAVRPLGNGNFAAAGFQFDANFQLPVVALSTNTVTSSVDLFPGNMAEIKPYTPASIISYSNGAPYSVFSSETKGRQILLNFYSESGEIRGTHRIGYLNPFTFSSIKVGSDNSLLVLGTTFVAGRFERIAFNKISEAEIASYVD